LTVVTAAKYRRDVATPVAALRLTSEQRRALEEIARNPRTPSLGRRARILLLAAEGRSNTDIALAVATSRATVQQWRNRFAAEGLAGVSAIRPGRGRKPRISEDQLRELIATTVGTGPAGGSWTCRRLARHLGVSPATISRVWRPPKTAPADSAPNGPASADSAGFLRRGQLALANHRWEDAYQLLAAADDAGALGPKDIEGLAEAAGWSGRPSECICAWERIHALQARAGDHRAAARAASELSRRCWDRATPAIARGWLRRAERHLAGDGDCVEQVIVSNRRAYLLLRSGAARAALEQSASAQQIAGRCDAREPLLVAMHLHGQALLKLGELDRGMDLIDEVCAAAVGGELGPESAGLIYCWTMAACRDLGDYEREAQLTDATTRWCEDNRIAAFPGVCRIHRAEIFRLKGALDLAEAEAAAAAQDMSRYSLFQTGNALSEMGTVRLRRGDLAGADEAFARAHEFGASTEPGRALLLLARGDRAAATAAISRGLARDPGDLLTRALLLPAQVEIALAVADLLLAADASRELGVLAVKIGRPGIAAEAATARGAVLLAQQKPAAAGRALMAALDLWMGVGAPYEAARTRALLSRAHRAEGDRDAARLELDAACQVFRRIGAVRDAGLAEYELAQLDRRMPAGLTSRQLDVAELIASGLSNRDIAQRMFISDRTAEYHVRQIMTRLGVDSRSQIAAWYSAYAASK
jgi:DNA-binding NarL/FixJ family response regulator